MEVKEAASEFNNLSGLPALDNFPFNEFLCRKKYSSLSSFEAEHELIIHFRLNWGFLNLSTGELAYKNISFTSYL